MVRSSSVFKKMLYLFVDSIICLGVLYDWYDHWKRSSRLMTDKTRDPSHEEHTTVKSIVPLSQLVNEVFE